MKNTVNYARVTKLGLAAEEVSPSETLGGGNEESDATSRRYRVSGSISVFAMAAFKYSITEHLVEKISSISRCDACVL